MTDFLLDNSVWSRSIQGDPNMLARLERIVRSPADLFVTCPPQVLDFCRSARTAAEHELYLQQISLGFPLELAPHEVLVLDMQAALWSAGLVRAAGPTDILIAAYAIVNNATVLAADHDFAHIARVTDLQYEYVAPSS